MKSFSTAAQDAIEAGDAIVSGAVEVACATPIRVWGGHGLLTFDGRTFKPMGDRALAQISSGLLGGTAQNVQLVLSGIEPEVLALLDASEVKGAPATLWRLIFSGDGQTLLDYQVFTRGRLDELPVQDVIGGTATITANVESAARGLGRRGGRMRSDADQRLINPTDGFYKNVAYAAEKTLYWGGKKPASAAAVLTTGMLQGTSFSSDSSPTRS